MDYTYAGYGNGPTYPNYFNGGLNVGFPPYSSMPYLYSPGMGRDRCLPEKQPESKARLSKDEVEILETNFQQNQKPSSTVKRDLAERMRVEIPRINNWFQNRRAKAKNERNQEEYKASQEAAAKAASQPLAQDQVSSVQEHFTLSNQQAPLQPCVASFSVGSPVDQISIPPARSGPASTNESLESITQSISRQEPPGFSHDNEMCSVEEAVFGQSSEGYLSTQPSCDDLNAMIECGRSAHEVSQITMYDELPNCADPRDGVFQEVLGIESVQMPLVSHPDFTSQTTASECASENLVHDISCSEKTSPSMMSSPAMMSSPSMMSSPPAPTGFKSPPPASDIAQRRNRRPLGLGGFPAHHIQPSLRTAAGDIPRRSGTASPIRRIASATGCASSRVMKSTSGSAPRSPMFSEQKREALLQSLQGRRSPAMGFSINAAVSVGPPTPRTPMFLGQQGVRENTASSTNSDEESLGYTYRQPQVASFVKEDDSSIKTPPGTPGVMPFSENIYAPNAIEAAYNYVAAPQEGPLFTPAAQGHGGFPPELDFHPSLAAPEYIASSGPSQPATPSFAPMGSTYYTGGVHGNEYNWPDSAMTAQYAPSARSSPGSKSKTFQFTPNMTPQHFNPEK